jgi:tetratricopeptide (TPR) repeat protein
VETITGFPRGSESPWPEPEQRELADFLRDLTTTRALVLVTSRGEERNWLGDMPARAALPPLPMRERLQVAQALAKGHRRTTGGAVDWRPLLAYSGGNPLAIMVLVGQALREGSTSPAAMAALVNRLRAGDEGVDAQGLPGPLGASLGYVLATAFSTEERARLGTLYLFQETVDADALVMLGNPDNPYQMPELAGLDRAAAIALLDRVADIGLLTALGGGHYQIHPPLVWYLRGVRDATDPGAARRTEAAYCTAIAYLGAYYHAKYREEGAPVLAALRIEEGNLLQARSLAWRAGRFAEAMGCMRGLSVLYRDQGRRAEWRRLVDDLVPALVDAASGGPRTGHDNEWAQLTEYRIAIAKDGRDWATAEHLQRGLLAHVSDWADTALAAGPSHLAGTERRGIRDVAAAQANLGLILREEQNPECVDYFQRAATLFARIGDRRAESRVAAELGLAYLSVPPLRDLDDAEQWYRRSLEMLDREDRLGQARILVQLGRVAYERYRDGREAGEPAERLRDYLTQAVGAYQQALADMPPDATADRAAAHSQLGAIYAETGQLDDAVAHLRESVRHYENAGDRYSAGISRFNLAVMLGAAGRFDEAVSYAQAALRDLEALGTASANQTAVIRQLITELGGPPASS